MKQLNLNVLHNLELNLFKDVVLKKIPPLYLFSI